MDWEPMTGVQDPQLQLHLAMGSMVVSSLFVT